VKLLTFLDARSFIKVGGRKVIQVDVRLLAATNSDLETLVKEGKFRSDLWYRLNVVPVELPALADRGDDILPLISLYLKRFCERHGVNKTIDRNVIDVLTRYHFPGNVRELENILEHCFVLCQSDEITMNDLPQKLLDSISPVRAIAQNAGSLKQALESVEREYLKSACIRYATQSDIARSLGTSQPTVARLLKKHNLRPA
jgi:DNA-binding NtrC family response regulator